MKSINRDIKLRQIVHHTSLIPQLPVIPPFAEDPAVQYELEELCKDGVLQVLAGIDQTTVVDKYRHWWQVIQLFVTYRQVPAMVNYGQFVTKHPDYKAHIELLQRCLSSLSDILTGRIQATAVMFPEGNLDVVSAVYKESPESRYFNNALAELVAATVAAAAEKVHILEIGAGTGGSSESIFKKLIPYSSAIEYTYTDISIGFLTHAETNYKAPYLKTALLDISVPCQGQGLPTGHYDLIIGANVVHATRDIARTLQNIKPLLKKDGLLFLNEIAASSLYHTLTFGLLDGWWLYEDKELRLEGGPGLPFTSWEMVLMETGFYNTHTVPVQTGLSQQLIIACSDGEIEEVAQVKKETAPVVNLGKGHVEQIVTSIVAGILNMQATALDVNTPITDYGVDSIVGLKLIKSINKELKSSLAMTILFDYPTISKLAQYLEANYGELFATERGKRLWIAQPGSIEDIQLQEFDVRRPAAGEVLVAVNSFSLNFGDLLCVKGLYPMMPAYPFALGFEAAGTIQETGNGVSGCHPGEEVLVIGDHSFGMHATHVIVDQARVFRKPAGMTLPSAVAFIAALAVCKKADVQPGDSILITSATGGVGLAALQYAKHKGARIIAAVGSEEKVKFLQQMGIRDVINYRQQDLIASVMQLTQGRGAAVILNTLATNNEAALAKHGRYIEMGKQGAGFNLRKLLAEDRHTTHTLWEECCTLLAKKIFTADTGKLFSFENYKQAYAYLESRESIGKVVVSMEAVPVEQKQVIRNTRDIAIIGISGQYGKAGDVHELWEALKKGESLIEEVPADRWNGERVVVNGTDYKWGSFLRNIDQFDPLFFRISGREAEMMDPHQRLFLQHCWKAIEDAGIAPDTLSASKCGVYVGAAQGDYLTLMNEQADAAAFWGNASSVLASRISYYLDLKGAAVSVDTACSSSLVAMELGYKSLMAGDTDLIISGGISLFSTPAFYRHAAKAGMLSPDGQCFTFDNRANGFVPGEGVGVVIMKRLEDAIADGNHIYGVIKGILTNQDGTTSGITAPSALAQGTLEKDVYTRFNIHPRTISYVEAHGTGTKLGDPIEFEGLKQSFGAFTQDQQYCAIGSLKSNLGHTLMAAGVGGVIKVLLALKYKTLPPSINFRECNPMVDTAGTPFHIQDKLTAWKTQEDQPRRAAVSSFGFGGTNAHLVIEEYTSPAQASVAGGPVMIVLSARQQDRLKEMAVNLKNYLQTHTTLKLQDIAYTLQTGRAAMEYRMAFVANSIEDLLARLGAYVAGHTTGISEGKAQRHFTGSADPEQWVNGAAVDWNALYTHRPQRVSLPAYPFAGERYWVQGIQKQGDLQLFRSVWNASEGQLQFTAEERMILLAGGSAELAEALQERLELEVGVLPAHSSEACFEALLHIVKTRIQQANPGSIVVVCQNEEYTDYGFLTGLLKVAELECPAFSGQITGVDDLSVSAIDTLTTLLGEYRTGKVIRHRGQIREEKILAAMDLPAQTGNYIKKGGVYLITGGAGGLGLAFARHLAAKEEIHIILAGRSEKDSPLPGVVYHRCDISDRQAVLTLVEKIRTTYGRLDGIIHCAGQLHDQLIVNASAYEQVLAAKVRGTINLDIATRDFKPDFIVYCSSIAAVLGNVGQAAYAAANAFLDNYATGPAKLSINWSLWESGGMGFDPAGVATLSRRYGMLPMPVAKGMEALDRLLGNGIRGQVVVTYGEKEKIVEQLTAPKKKQVATVGFSIDELRQLAAQVLKLKPSAVDIEEKLGNYGFDSVLMTTFANEIQLRFGLDVQPTVFYNYPTIATLGKYLLEQQPVVAPVMAHQPVSKNDDIAIIGISARFPGAPDIATFWEKISAGSDLVTEVPAERWDWRQYDGDPATDKNKTKAKWGGFIADIDKFDPQFFGISPKEAVLMDPQQRITLEAVYHALEDAGLNISELSGSDTGVFIGTYFNDYASLLDRNGLMQEAQSTTGLAHSVLANRISYLFNFHGPSEPVDTACSSSLVAIHRGVEHIRNGHCGLVVAGGVSLNLLPDLLMPLSQAGLLSETGRCMAFDQRANGYVRGEGVGIVVLKSLDKAVADGDPVYGVIKGSAINHGGRANTLTSPEPNAQKDLLLKAWKNAGVAPTDISFIEAHGTGTRLGDPIETEGLKLAFDAWNKKHFTGAPFCGIGTVKTNIGHLEAAAGVAGVIKVLLSLQHGVLPGNPHLQQPNQYLRLNNTPFYLLDKTQNWTSTAKQRIAGVSSFGFGGSNAHVVIAEYQQTAAYQSAAPAVIVLSAANSARLKAYAASLSSYLSVGTTAGIHDIAYTLQTGRVAMEERLAFEAADVETVVTLLTQYLHGDESKIYTGNITNIEPGTDEAQLSPAAQWVRGIKVNWTSLYPAAKPAKVSLPGYPFERKRYWLDHQGFGLPAQVPEVESFAESPFTPLTNTNTTDTLSSLLLETLFLDAPIGIDSKFVDHGMDSITGVEYVKNINRTFGTNISATDLYDHPTLRRLSNFIDGNATPAPEVIQLTDLSVTPARDVLPALSVLLKETLFLEEEIGADSKFVDHGMDSITGVEYVKNINRTFGTNISATDLYDHPTLRRLAAFVGTDTPEIAPLTVLPDVNNGYGYVVKGVQHIADTRLESFSIPAPGADEVQVKVMASAINFPDIMCVKGLYPTQPPYPFVPGFEIAGTVIAVGANVQDIQMGDEVMGLTGYQMGGHADQVNVPVAAIVKKPAQLSFEEACSLPVIFLTTWYALQKAQLQRGENLLVQTAAGGIGLMAVQLGRMFGAGIVGTSGNTEKLSFLQSIGIKNTINYKASDFTAQARKVAAKGFDVVLNTLSGPMIQAGLDLLSPGGRYIELAVHGLKTGGKLDLSGLTQNQEMLSVDLRRLMTGDRMTSVREILTKLTELVTAGKIHPVVSRIYPIHEISQAMTFVESGRHIGKVVMSHTATTMIDCTSSLQQLLSPLPPTKQSGTDIAIVGISGRMPGANNMAAFWANLKEGVNSVSEVPDNRWPQSGYFDTDPKAKGKSYSKWMGMLDDVAAFDPLFFNISPLEAELMDPQQRLFLEESWKAIEDAGYAAGQLSDKHCGVFIGVAHGDYGTTDPVEADAYHLTGNSSSILSARISYLLNLKGPCLAIDTACSSSLVAIAQACDSLLLGNCELALAGGVSIRSTPVLHVMMSKAGMLSPDGHCYTFDQRANGFVPGEAVGVVILKKLDDAIANGDHIHGIIKGWGVNQDGATNGITAPSKDSQVALMKGVYDKFGIDPVDIGYVEAHGTGTKLGDPIEMKALQECFRSYTNQVAFCGVGSVKSNIGHALTAAGMPGIFKILLSFKHGQLPPSLHYTRLNEHINMDNSPFFITDQLQDWKAPVRRAAISSFGFSGTNAHIVLEEYKSPVSEKYTSDVPAIIVLSAKDVSRLQAHTAQLLDYVKTSEADVYDIAYTLQTGREPMEARLAFEITNKAQLVKYLETGAAPAVVSPLAQQWLNGKMVDWSVLYKNTHPRRISLPAYPFAREQYWANKSVFADHKVGDKALMPAVGYLEIARKAGAEKWGQPVLQIKNVTWLKPLTNDKQIDTHITASGAFEISTAAGVHSQGVISTEMAPVPDQSVYDIDHLRSTLSAPITGPACYELFASRGLHYGASFQGIKTCYYNKDVALSYIEQELTEGLLDSALQTCMAHQFLNGTHEVYLPYSVRAVNTYSTLPARIWAYAVKHPAHFDIYLLDESGKVCMTFMELVALRPAKQPAIQLFRAAWMKEADIPLNTSAQPATTILLAGASAELAEKLQERLEVEVGILTDSSYEAAYGELLTKIKTIIRQDQPAGITLVCRNEEYSDYGFLAGLLKTATQECPHFSGRVIGVEVLSLKAIDTLTTILSSTGNDAETRYQGEEKEVKTLSLLNPAAATAAYIKDGGVYLITGGAGGLGRAFADHLLTKGNVQVILTGRSEQPHIPGYHRCDVSDREAVLSLMAMIKNTYGRLDGIIHCAGQLHDKLILNTDNYAAVLAAKVRGTIHLDAAAKDFKPDFTVYCSSVAAVTGNIGQAAYSAANAFMDNYALGAKGRKLSINWSLWEAAGMALDEDNKAALARRWGIVPLPIAKGMAAFDLLMSNEITGQVVVTYGDTGAITAALRGKQIAARSTTSSSALKPAAEAYLRKLLSTELKLAEEKISGNTHFEKYGIDSILINRLTNKLDEEFGHVPRTLFFEYQTLSELADYFVAEHGPRLEELTGITATVQLKKQVAFTAIEKQHEKEDIAIIGLSGRYPGADNLSQFWDNLQQGRNSITEIPSDRWELKDFYNQEKGLPGKSYSKWGGFISDVDKFDSLLFNISPREAAFMDPQERLFLQTVWETLEDAAYTRDQLGHKVGVYVGVMYEEYQLLGLDEKHRGNFVAPGGSPGSIANRVSYYFNLQGPSIALDTMCSSSLTAIHLACESLYNGSIDYAIAGGVNVSIHPNKYLMLSQGRFVSEKGHCESFGEGGDGYVPGEGVGAVLLKPLSKAIADGDHIYGVIRSSAVNHGGKTNNYTVPNPRAQAALVNEALQKAGLGSASITYIEAHGTGTSLGDPIEIAGLVKAFDTTQKQFCSIGSVKSNIGHAESAAGISGLTKVLLQMQHRQLVPSLHSQVLNPHIDFANSPFKVQQSLAPWESPRNAGVSSFGAGGSNAHLIISEYISDAPPITTGEFIIPLSAKNKERLHELVTRILTYLQQEVSLYDMAFTLQTGREALDERLAVTVTSQAELITAFNAYLQGDTTHTGNARKDTPQPGDSLAATWTKGGTVDWSALYTNRQPRRLSLPTYPFAKERHWISKAAPVAEIQELAPLSLIALAPIEEVAAVTTAIKLQTLHTGSVLPDLRRLLQAALYIETDIDEQLAFVELGLDSITGVELIKSVNDHFDIQLEATKLYDYPTLTALTGYIHELKGSIVTEPVDIAPTPLHTPTDHSVIAKLKELFAATLYLEAELDEEIPFVESGLDSITGVEFIKSVNQQFDIKIEATRLYDYPTFTTLAGYIHELLPAAAPAEQPSPQQPQPTVVPVVKNNPAPINHNNKIAIVGISGRYAGSPDLAAYWHNISNGIDCVKEVSRWNIDEYYEENGPVYSRWLGEVANIDQFDPLFFNISPTEAALMDPQHRIFLEECWKAIEDAGYTRSQLNGKKCGTYVGIMGNEYAYHVKKTDLGPNLAQSMTGNSSSIFSARLAYLLNLKGPAIAIDTACSSSLVATHLACQALLSNEIDMAVAGGVTLYLGVEPYQQMCAAGMLSPDGKCKSFDNSANGFVPGDGAGVIILKRLADAVRDGDNIHGVIIGSGINQDGKTNGITAPSVNAQTDLLSDIYRRFDIDPATISYIETHGTGTRLGDPIEIEALTKAFNTFTSQQQFCAVGAVKSNIGHSSAAAGVAGMEKVLLQFKHQQLVPSLHYQQRNEFINFAASPFYVNTTLKNWEANNNHPRRAAVSSFGFSGTNAHIVMEEYTGPVRKAISTAPAIVILSARNKERLLERAVALKDFVAQHPHTAIHDLSYTLQTGRESMDERLAIVCTDTHILQEQLSLYLSGKAGNYTAGNARKSKSDIVLQGGAGQAYINYAIAHKESNSLAGLWVSGVEIDWQLLYEGARASRISLPTYPFAKDRYWIDTVSETPATGRLHPLLHSNESDLFAQKYKSIYTGKESFLTDHQVNSEKIFPAAGYIELLREAGHRGTGKAVTRLRDLTWLSPIKVNGTPAKVWTRLQATGAAVNCEVYSDDRIHCQGQVENLPLLQPSGYDLHDIQSRMTQVREGSDCYTAFSNSGFQYGKTFQGIVKVYFNGDEALSEIRMKGENGHVLSPGVLDSALQTCICLGFNDNNATLQLPFSVGEINIYASFPEQIWCYVKKQPKSYEIAILNNSGEVLLELKNFVAIAPKQLPPAEPPTTLLSVWERVKLIPADLQGTHLILGGGAFGASLSTHLQNQGATIVTDLNTPGLQHIYLLQGLDQNEDATVAVFNTIKSLLTKQSVQITCFTQLTQQVNPADTVRSQGAGIRGLAGALAKEYPEWKVRVIDLDTQINVSFDKLLQIPFDTENTICAYRNGAAFAPHLYPMALPAGTGAKFRKGGVYVILGGAGGLGRVTTTYLTKHYQAKVIWLGRTTPEDTQDAIHIPCDATSKESVTAALHHIQQMGLEIHGLFHSAIVLNDMLLSNMNEADFRKAYHAKSLTSQYLLEVFGPAVKDFICFYSSVQSHFNAAGQSNYAAGCTFKDSYARSMEPRLSVPVYTINWGYWGETGIVSSSYYRQRMAAMGIGSISADEGMQVMEQILANENRQVAVIKFI